MQFKNINIVTMKSVKEKHNEQKPRGDSMTDESFIEFQYMLSITSRSKISFMQMYSGKVLDWLSRWLSSKESACQCRRHRRHRFNPWVEKILWKRKWWPTPVFLLGKLHGQRGAWWATVHGVSKSQTWLRDGAHTPKD